ncbi:MAG: DALR anticodon-binding domain-containing protein, partial [Terriglobia bacterium]
FTESEERALYDSSVEMEDRLARYETDGDYAQAFRALAELRPKVDAFFDKVLVMHPDERLRQNRLRLLSQLNRLVFLRLADLSEIVPAGGE